MPEAPVTASQPRLRVSNERILQALAVISWALTLLSNVRYGFGRRSPWDHGHQNDVGFTPFTASLVPIVIYWLWGGVTQGVYLFQFFGDTAKQLSWHFIVSNSLLLSWSYLFSRSHYVIAEGVVVLNLVNLSAAVLFSRTYAIRPLSKWLALHGSVVVFPIVWTFYLLFWNGAVMFGARNIFPRLLANLLIWLFLVIPGAAVVLAGDYLTGLASSWIVFAIGLGQLFTKVFALQWIFAFSIATTLLVLSLLFAFTTPPRVEQTPEEQAPLLTEP